ncbi:hypothetical protein [Bacteroides acidifaciens]|uniref:hypothetical protein n=3 Tax=Bacteroides acidifaciens TaxID=85831 RepID=UPI00242F2CBF|nr:hypothetical protein [Bacteroides acidifaciens]
MNVTVYLFGEFLGGYMQYPDDYTSKIFQNFQANAKMTTQIAIHRDGNLMYYGYIRKLEKDRYIGFCVVLNGLLLVRIDGLFTLFENIISNLVTKGRLIHFDEQGEIVTRVEKLYMNREEISLLAESLRGGFNRFENSVVSLPAISYGTVKDSVKNFVVEDDLNEIIKSTYTNGYTYIYKSKGFNTAQLNSYKGVLAKSYKEKEELTQKLTALQIEYAKTLRQKKQIKMVLFLFAILLGCVVFLFSMNESLNITRNNLSSANETIHTQQDSLTIKNIQISNLYLEKRRLEHNRRVEELKRRKAENDLDSLYGVCIEAENNFNSLRKMINECQPFIVKNISFNFDSEYLRLNYYGFTEEMVTIQVDVYSEYGNFCTKTTSLDVHYGDNIAVILLPERLDRSKRYFFALLKDNIFIGGGKH